VAGRGWAGSWQLDPAMLDGGLQAAVLWARRTLGAASLPTSLGGLHIYRSGPIPGNVRCVLVGREHAHDRALSDAVFLTQDGIVLAELRGIEVHALSPSERPADSPEKPGRRSGSGSAARS